MEDNRFKNAYEQYKQKLRMVKYWSHLSKNFIRESQKGSSGFFSTNW